MSPPMHYAPPLLVLGIETQCDETAAAVMRREMEGVTILSDIVLGQVEAARAVQGRGAGDRRAGACGGAGRRNRGCDVAKPGLVLLISTQWRRRRAQA